MMRNIKIVEVPCDLGAGCRGASLGVDALRMEAVADKCVDFLSLPKVRTAASNAMLNQPDPTPHAHYIEGIVDFYQQGCELTAQTLKEGKFPLVIAGDHSTAGGTIAGVKKHAQGKKVGVIWIDAHADIHSPYTTPSGNVHGMPLAVSLQFDNKSQAINNLSESELKHWEDLKKVGGEQPKIVASEIVYLGVRDTEEQEDITVEKLSIPNTSVAAARKMGVQQSVMQAVEKLSACEVIYVSFDVDSMDPSVSKGTGTPVSNGFSEAEAVTMLKTLINQEKVVALEVVEINPMLDNENAMAKATLRILKKVFDWR